MRVRAMRIIIMFDMPSVNKKDLRSYNRWHRFLVNTGFVMMTESVYSHLVINKSVSTSVKKLIYKNLPKDGIIQLLEITEKQYAEIEYCLGESKSNVVNTIERYVEI